MNPEMKLPKNKKKVSLQSETVKMVKEEGEGRNETKRDERGEGPLTMI